MVSAKIQQHFRPAEAPFIDQATDWLATAGAQYRPVLTDFLNPRQRYVLQALPRPAGVKIAFRGGYPTAEMQRALVFPDYYQPQLADFDLQLLAIDYPTKFAVLHHRQILGALLATGIDRAALGDIITQKGRWQVTVKQNLTRYLVEQVTAIGKVKVKLMPVDLTTVLVPEEDWEPVATTIAAPRLDAVVAAAFNYSRNRAKLLVEHGQVRVNWQTITRPDYELRAADLLSVRHAGRVRLQQVGELNRHGRERVQIAVIRA